MYINFSEILNRPKINKDYFILPITETEQKL